IRLDKEQLPALYKPGHDFSTGYCIFGDKEGSLIVSTGIETWRARQEMPAQCVVDVFRLKPTPDCIGFISDSLEDWADDLSIWDEHHPNGGLFSIIAEAKTRQWSFVKTLPDKFLMGATVREPVGDKPLAWVDDGYGIPFGGE